MGDQQLGHYLRLLRIKNSLTMSQTAEVTGITQGYISQIENGIYTPSARTLAKLARAYMVPEMHLLRKAGIVEGLTSTPVLERFSDPDLDIDGSEAGDAEDILDMLRRGLSGLESMAQQKLQRAELSSLPASREDLPQAQELSSTMLLPVYDINWQPLRNLAGEAAALALPAHFCADDEGAFIVVLEDNAMSPRLIAGDWVVISPGSEAQNGAVVAISDRRQIQLRSYSRAGEIQSFMPLNPEFASRTLVSDGRSERVEMVGTVLRLVNRNL